MARCGDAAKAYEFLMNLRDTVLGTGRAALQERELPRVDEALDVLWRQMTPAQRVSVSRLLAEHYKDRATAAALIGA